MKQSVLAIIFNENKSQVVLIKRRDVPVWVLPGGGVDNGETPEIATIREVLEETGLNIGIHRKTGEYSPLNKLTKLTHIYECKILSGKLHTGEETRDIAFFPIQLLPKAFFHIHRDWLMDALQNETQIIKKPIYQVTYWKVFCYFLRHPIRIIRAILARFGVPINSQ